MLISVCISQEQEGNQYLFSEEISSNVYITENSPNTGNLIDTINIEKDEILDLENIPSHFPIEEKNSDSDNKDDFFNMSLVDTINLEKSKSYDIKNVLDEVQCSLMDSLIDPFYPSFKSEKLPIHIETEPSSLMETKDTEHKYSVELENKLGETPSTLPDSQTQPSNLPLEHENSIIYIETDPPSISLMGTKYTEHKYYVELQDTLGEIPSTLPDSQTQSFNLLFEHDYAINVTHGKSFSVNNLMNTENVEQEDPVELQNILDEILNTLPDSLTEPIDLLSEHENSTIHAEAGPSNISLMGTENEKHNDSYNPQYIFNYSLVTPNYLKEEFLNLLLEDQCPSINYEDIFPTTSNLMIPENVEDEEYIKLQIIPVDFPIEKPATTINYNEDMSLLDEIEQIS
ncbi:fam-j protein, partial [Plasmodium relictum]